MDDESGSDDERVAVMTRVQVIMTRVQVMMTVHSSQRRPNITNKKRAQTSTPASPMDSNPGPPPTAATLSGAAPPARQGERKSASSNGRHSSNRRAAVTFVERVTRFCSIQASNQPHSSHVQSRLAQQQLYGMSMSMHVPIIVDRCMLWLGLYTPSACSRTAPQR